MATEKADRVRTRESGLGYRMGPGLAAVAEVEGELCSEGRLVQLSPEHLTLSLTKPTGLRPGQRTNVLPWPYVEGLRLDEAAHPRAVRGGHRPARRRRAGRRWAT